MLRMELAVSIVILRTMPGLTGNTAVLRSLRPQDFTDDRDAPRLDRDVEAISVDKVLQQQDEIFDAWKAVLDGNSPASESSLTGLPFTSTNPLQIGGIQGGPAPGARAVPVSPTGAAAPQG